MAALQAKVRWRARRGLLELDLFFQRFIDQGLARLDEESLQTLLELLESDDHELWAMLNGKAQCSVERWQPLIALLRRSAPDTSQETVLLEKEKQV
ncbi:MAG: hypothetical protein BSR46_03035 [Candidatus Dactylopiibacterium carminicum]|nr:MAG: hypothetical protein BSR46_03035 [Candidatus Dactylopiibacterium carminicum]